MQASAVCKASNSVSSRHLLVALSLAVAGCVGPVDRPTGDRPLGETEGAAVLSVTSNTARVSRFDEITLIRFKQSDSGKLKYGGIFWLRQVSWGMARDTALFVGALPEGYYEFDRFTEHDKNGETYLELNPKMKAVLGGFHVKAGAVTDLGRIVVTGIEGQMIVGRSTRLLSNQELVRRFAPDSAAIYTGQEPQTWAAPRSPHDRVEDYALLHPVGADAMAELSGGRVVAGSRLGTVLLRDPAGRWRAVRSDGLESILWVKPYERGNMVLIAVGELTTMLKLERSAGDARLTRIDPGNLPPGNLLFIDGNDAVGWYVLHQYMREITAYRSARLEGGDWQPIGKASFSPSFLLQRGELSSLRAWSTPDGFAYGMSDGVIRQYSFAARNWTERRMPSGDMLKIVAQPNNVLGVHVKGLISVRYLSRDGGATWNKIDAPFSQELVPYLTPAGTVLSIEADSRQARLHASKDSGKTWQQLSADLGRVEDLVVLPTAGLFALTPDWGTADFIATIKHSADGGATWKTEYSTADQPRRQAQKSD